MDEIKSVISQLPPQDIAILKTLYNPEVARGELSDNWQRMIAILDWLSPEEQQEAVSVTIEVRPEEPAQPEQPVEEAPVQEEAPVTEEPQEQMPNPAGNLEDFLI